jgi:hypothetical protein
MQKAISYDFSERLKMSCGHSASKDVFAILTNNIPSALNAFPAHSKNDRQGTDWWIECRNGNFLSVDCKVRSKDYAVEDDLALETWSVIESGIVGWTRNPDKRSDYILWLWTDTGRWCLIPFQMLCCVFSEKWKHWSTIYKPHKQRTPWKNGTEYHSECIFVPRREVWSEIYKRYSGSPNRQD